MRRVHLPLLLWILAVSPALAQAPAQAPAAPPAEPPIWTGSLGAGLAMTSGNADTTNFNLGIKLSYDPRSPHLVTGDVFYLHGTSEGDTIVSRTSLNVRDDYTWTERTTFFGQFRFLRDTFKGIDPLAAAVGGVGYKLVNLEPTKFAIDVGGGVVWERNPGFDTSTSGALTLGETFSHRFSSAATFTHSANGLWKTSDFGDALYTIAAGLAAAITPRTQLKVEVLELYKAQPPLGIEKGDLSLITSVVYSF
jgi:putative salt-induced outer membrane protein YdiY